MQDKDCGVAFVERERGSFLQKLAEYRSVLLQAKACTVFPDLMDAFDASIKKVEVLREDVQNGKLKIALVGAFSDGKTSTVAGFLRHADSTMKIAESESSDEIVSYSPENIPVDVPPCEFIDTPGLFGQKFSKITEDYISQAHIILFVVNATNPLKESHKPTVEWLMRTLKKFDNTIFVINRMDDVCDYTDPEDYEQKAKTKTKVLRQNVERFCGLTGENSIDDLNVVCIASNPGNKGLSENGAGGRNYWLTADHLEKYEQYSRMSALRQMVGCVLSRTYPRKLIENSALAAVEEEARRNCERLDEELTGMKDAVIPEKKRMIEALSDDLSDAKDDLNRAIRPCRNELVALENSVCEKIRLATAESFTTTVRDVLGGDGDEIGYKLSGQISDILRDHFEGIAVSLTKKIEDDVAIGNSNVGTALAAVKTGANTIGKLGKGVDKQLVFAARDLLGKLGIVIKFKPWQAAKLADFASKGVPMISGAISLLTDIGGMVADSRADKKLQGAKQDLDKLIRKMFKPIYDALSDRESNGEFFKIFAPQVIEIEKEVSRTRDELEQLEKACSEIAELRKKIDVFWLDDDKHLGQTDKSAKKGWFRRVFSN